MPPRTSKKPASRATSSSKTRAPRAPAASGETDASARIDRKIRDLGDWRGQTLARMRELILDADPDMIEEIKWVKPTNPSGVPVWSHGGIVCTGEVYKSYVKLTFARGASLADPSRLFNASLEGGTRRAIDIREGDTIDAAAFKKLVKSAVRLLAPTTKKPTKKR